MRNRFQFPTFFIFLFFTLLLVTVQAAPVSDSEDITTTTRKSSGKPTSTTKNVSSTTRTDKATTTKGAKDSKPTSKSIEAVMDDSDEEAVILPKNVWPFDTNLGRNFTEDSCPQFIETFVSSKAFKDCMPLSPLIQNSRAFLQAQKIGGKTITTILDATCNVDFRACSSVMEAYGRDIRLPGACEADFQLRNPIVTQAYAAFIAYEPIYKAGCLKNEETGDYCYLDALESGGSDSYLYWLALGKNMPEEMKSGPSCNKCVKDTMGIFYEVAGNASQPLSGTYEKAAQVINKGCGADYINATVAPSASSAAGSYLSPIPILTTALLFLATVFLI